MKTLALIVAILIAFPYLRSPVYDFPAPRPFSGGAFFNPYQNRTATWQRANLHAHGRPWWGLTNGRQTGQEIVRRYRGMGYSVPGVSDYHSIAAHHGVQTLPLYEHGYSVGKRHQLAIGAHRVDWFDFLLWQRPSHQQYVIDRVGATAALVALAHPPSRQAYTADDLQQLTGYELLEVVNGPFVSEVGWDAALSAGRPIWALANDDTHDLENVRRTAQAWTMIDAATPAAGDIVEALRTGRSYAVYRTNEIASAADTVVDRIHFEGGRLTVTNSGEAATFMFVGQNGQVRKTEKQVMSASYAFTPEDTYIRVVIRAPRTAMLLNPIFRSEDGALPSPAASVNAAATWALRTSSVAIALALLYVRFFRERRLRLPRGSSRVLAPVDRETA